MAGVAVRVILEVVLGVDNQVPQWFSIQKEGDFPGARGQARPQRGGRVLPVRAFHFGC